jgi:hypothetical protein
VCLLKTRIFPTVFGLIFSLFTFRVLNPTGCKSNEGSFPWKSVRSQHKGRLLLLVLLVLLLRLLLRLLLKNIRKNKERAREEHIGSKASVVLFSSKEEEEEEEEREISTSFFPSFEKKARHQRHHDDGSGGPTSTRGERRRRRRRLGPEKTTSHLRFHEINAPTQRVRRTSTEFTRRVERNQTTV